MVLMLTWCSINSPARNQIIQGSGLGLSIVKGFTEALGGTVELKKSNSNGSTFIIFIPVKTTHLKIPEQ